MDDTTRNILADISPCEPGHEWFDGECQRCGDLHPDDCAGCDPHAVRVPDHEYQEPTCADCGEYGERTGHMGCQYPQDHD
jgi:hypothetical protein